MQLPAILQSEINNAVARINPQIIAKAQFMLSESYRKVGQHQHMISEADRLAYCAVRMPATFAAVSKVLIELKKKVPHIHSLIDFGAGPGTVLWAATETLDPFIEAFLFEADSQLIKLGEKFSKAGNLNGIWKQTNLANDLLEIPVVDLGVFSYSYGELPQDQRKKLLELCWKTVTKAIAIIEPGTPQGYKNMLEARDLLLGKGAAMVAPCPHGKRCPMKESDWCHFAVRLERSHLHQMVKEAYRGYEDEKFSYAILAKIPVSLPENRILRHPTIHSGHINLTLCSEMETIINTTISKRMGPLYKDAKDAEWGDTWPP